MIQHLFSFEAKTQVHTSNSQSEKVACDMIFRGSVVAATFQFLQSLFVGGLIFRGGRCLLLLKIYEGYGNIESNQTETLKIFASDL